MAVPQPIKNTLIVLILSFFIIGFIMINSNDLRIATIYGFLALASFLIYNNWNKLRRFKFG